MPEQVQCPSCLQKLRVPDTLLGKKVKCPKCSTVFEAKGKQETEDEEGGSYVFKPEPVPEPKKKSLRKLSDDDDSDEDEGDEDEERRPKKKRRHNAEALKKVSGPATGLQVTAVLALLSILISIPLNFSSALQERVANLTHQPHVERDMSTKVGQGIGTFISFLIQIAILSGASKMKQLVSYRGALVISIIAFLPCTCCIVGLPVGIWSLVVINSPEVRPYFKS